MTKVRTTAKCKDLLAKAAAHGIIDSVIKIYGSDASEFTPNQQKAVLDPKSWKRHSKVTLKDRSYVEKAIEADNYDDPMLSVAFESSRNVLDESLNPVYLKYEDAKYERTFYCLPDVFETAIGYVVIEDNDGKLYLIPENYGD